jgi:hypothetical protein
MRFKVYSARHTDLEAGYAPYLEGVFKHQKEAETYAESWRALYSGDHDFWVSDT